MRHVQILLYNEVNEHNLHQCINLNYTVVKYILNMSNKNKAIKWQYRDESSKVEGTVKDQRTDHTPPALLSSNKRQLHCILHVPLHASECLIWQLHRLFNHAFSFDKTHLYRNPHHACPKKGWATLEQMSNACVSPCSVTNQASVWDVDSDT